jgi:hypothetical protein
LTLAEAAQCFRYFVIDNSLILAILEETPRSQQEAQPTVRLSEHTPPLTNLLTHVRFS